MDPEKTNLSDARDAHSTATAAAAAAAAADSQHSHLNSLVSSHEDPGQKSSIRLPPISFISGLKRSHSQSSSSAPPMASTNLSVSAPTTDVNSPKSPAQSLQQPHHYNNSTTLNGTNGGNSPYELRKLSNSTPTLSKPLIDNSPRPKLPLTSFGEKPNVSNTNINVKSSYQLPSISSFDTDNRTNLKSILNNNENNTAPPIIHRSYSNNINSLLNDDTASDSKDESKKNNNPLQTRIIIHQHHPNRLLNRDDPPSANTTVDNSYNSFRSGDKLKLANIMDPHNETTATIDDTNNKTKILEEKTIQIIEPKPVIPAKEFKKPITTVDNSDAIEFASKFPRRNLGTIMYSLSPTMTLQTMLGGNNSSEELESVYRSEIKKSKDASFILPEMRRNINGILTVKVPSFYLSAKNNPNLNITKRNIWGTDIYTDDSDIVGILKHCGFLDLNDEEYDESDDGEENRKELQLRKDLKELLGEIERIIVTPGFSRSVPNVLYKKGSVDVDDENKEESGKSVEEFKERTNEVEKESEKPKEDLAKKNSVKVDDKDKSDSTIENHDKPESIPKDELKKDDEDEVEQNTETEKEDFVMKEAEKKDKEDSKKDSNINETQKVEDEENFEEQDKETKSIEVDDQGDMTKDADKTTDEVIISETLISYTHLVPPGNKSDITVELLVLPPLQKYKGSFRNGINSRNWSTTHDGVSISLYSVKFDDYIVEKVDHKNYSFVLHKEKNGEIEQSFYGKRLNGDENDDVEDKKQKVDVSI